MIITMRGRILIPWGRNAQDPGICGRGISYVCIYIYIYTHTLIIMIHIMIIMMIMIIMIIKM